jgi:anti-sigma B factor antagonist
VAASSITSAPATDLVRIEVLPQGSTVRLKVGGEIDSSSAPVLAQRLLDVLAGPLSELVVDLCDVTFLDSAGLSVLASAHRRAVEKQASMHVLASSRAVVRPLQITGLWQLLNAEQVRSDERDASVA